MRIIIEVDSNNQPEIKTQPAPFNEQQGAVSSSSATAAMDAGFAKISEPEMISFSENDMSTKNMDTSTQGNNAEAIDAGSFNGTQSDQDGNTILSSHQNNLAAALTSGSALDAGGPKLQVDDSGNTTISSETGQNIFDRNNAMSAGEFIHPE